MSASALKSVILAGARRAATRWRVWRSPAIRHCGHDVHIGTGCRFWAPREIRIGAMSYIGKHVSVETNLEIGRFGLIANRVTFVGRHDHEFSRVGVPTRFGRWVGGTDADPAVANEGVVVEDDVWIGFGCIVLSGVRIGRGSVVAAGALVTRDIPPYSIAVGVPARVVRSRFASAEEIAAHERAIELGQFRFSERGYEHWVVAPAVDAAYQSSQD